MAKVATSSAVAGRLIDHASPWQRLKVDRYWLAFWFMLPAAAFLLLFLAYPLLFLPFLSSAFVPTDGMPGPVRWFAEHQPVTSIVDTLRNLYAEQPVGNDIWTALVWCVGLLVVAYVLAMRVYHRKIA